MVQIPLAMDAIGCFVVAASAPLDIKVWKVDSRPASELGGEATTTLTLVRELSIMSVGQPLRVRSLPLPHQSCRHTAHPPSTDLGNRQEAYLDM